MLLLHPQFFFSKLPLAKSALSNRANHGHPRSSHDQVALQQNRVRVAEMVVSESSRALLLSAVSVVGIEVSRLINKHIHLLDKQTIGRHAVTCLEHDDVADAKLTD